jgi:5'-deoxynucleotidase YfbR-like HD superfamily hydrolase
MTDGMATAEAPPARILDLLRELGELKRIRSAAHEGSIAERHFAAAWAALVSGRSLDETWRAATAAALAVTRLGDIDRGVLARVGIEGAEAEAIIAHAVDEASGEMDPTLRAGLCALPDTGGALPPFVAQLARQPRAGVTCPGHPRLLLEPPENHAEHCLVTAIYGVILSPFYGARPDVVFLASLAHHLHNAIIPDSGFAGEILLGDHLESVFARATEMALAGLPSALAERVRETRRILPDAGTPEGRAFHAADTLDRVLQIEQHLRAGKATMHYVLHDMELVHAGPVRGFQDRLLSAMGLAA